MEKIVSEYERMLDKLFVSTNQYPERSLAMHTAAKGHQYGDLMVVGRAVNGWDVNIDNQNSSNKGDLLEVVDATLRNENWMGNLKWVTNRWGVNDGKYNTKKSAFWRVVNELSDNFSDKTDNDLYFDSIVWSNLYKVAPEDGGNPSSKLRNVIFENCLNILREEIVFFKPKYVIFLTGYEYWADRFIKGLGVESIGIPEMRFVKYAGIYNNVRIIVAQHPMRKPEELHVNEINEMCEFIK